MTSFTETWNATYETLPADSEDAKDGANRIRKFKTAVQERVEVDHSHAGDAHDGKHNKVTLRVQSGDPGLDAGDTAIYTKDVAGTKEAFHKNSAGAVVQLTKGAELNYFPAGTRLLFQQTAAPTGWTKETSGTYNDAALRIVTGAAGTGGADGFTTTFAASRSSANDGGGTSGAHAISLSEMPAHSHQETAADPAGPVLVRSTIGGGGATLTSLRVTALADQQDGGTLNTSVDGGSATHSHSTPAHQHTLPNFNLKFADCIIAAKD